MDNQEDLYARIVCIIQGVIKQSLQKDDSMSTKENWDAMAQLTILTLIEQEYNIEFDIDELEKVDSVVGWVEALKKKVR
jgi:acyl carrier protein